MDFSNSDDTIDSRSVIERITDLEDDIYNVLHPGDDDVSVDESTLDANSLAELEELKEELAILKALADEASDYASDWTYGETLIRDSYFEDYAQQLAEDCCNVDFSKLTWPLTCIDWKQAAKELKYDYASVDYDGVTYWIRSC